MNEFQIKNVIIDIITAKRLFLKRPFIEMLWTALQEKKERCTTYNGNCKSMSKLLFIVLLV